MLKIGDTDSSGLVVKTILGQSSKATVYTTENKELRWDLGDPDVPPELAPAIAKSDHLMSETFSVCPKKHKPSCYDLLGKTLFSALNEDTSEKALSHFYRYENYLHGLAQQQKRTQYVFECILICLLFVSVLLLLIYNLDAPHKNYLYGSICGSIGACMSVMQRAKNIDIDWTLEGGPLLLQAAIRIVLGALCGVIFILACKSDFLLGAFKEQVEALFLLALVSGFSERIIPDLFSRLEITASENA